MTGRGNDGVAIPEVTIAIPTIDRPVFLRRAIASALSQEGESVEIVVSDNASEGDIEGVVQSFADTRIRFQRHERRLTMTDNWNSCLQVARGRFFMLLSDDDSLCEGGLRALRERLSDDHPDRRVGISYGRSIVVDPADRVLWRSSRGSGRETLISFISALFAHSRAIYPCSTLFRTADLAAIGGYDGAHFGAAADLAAAVAVGQQVGFVGFVDADVCRYTEHGGNLTTQQDVSHWAADIRAIASLAMLDTGLDAVMAARLHSRADAFAAYFVMDVVVRREIRRGANPLVAWRIADDARRRVVPGMVPRARARALAKAVYLWVWGAKVVRQPRP